MQPCPGPPAATRRRCLAQRVEHRLGEDHRRHVARTHCGRRLWVDHQPFSSNNRHRAIQAFVGRHKRVHHRLQAKISRRIGMRERHVLAACDLRRAIRQVEREVAVLDRQRDGELDALAADAVFVEPVNGAICAFFQHAADAGAHAQLRRIEHLVHALQHRFVAILDKQLLHPRVAASTGRHLRHEIALAVMRHARIEVEHFKHVGTRLAGHVNLHRRYAYAFLKNAHAVAGLAAGHAAANVRMMRDRCGKRDEASFVEDRRRHGAIVEMRYTDDIRIVRQECIAGAQGLSGKPLEDCADQPQGRTEVRRRIGHQRQRTAGRVADRGRAVGALLDVR